MRPKRTLSPHQKQIRFFTVLGGIIAILITAVMIWLFSTKLPVR